ncbi:MAG: type IV pilus assembly protein PilM [Deltaproteobacteria bacterium]|nr:MAG: type IV pilus assembly protein PilM [Deltaproteobacteria bacterium]
MARQKNVIGLDIGSSSVKLVQLKETKRGYQLLNLGMAPLPHEAIVDGALMNSTVIVSTIRDLVQSLRIRHKEVGLAISGHSVIIKKITLPAMTEEELEESIQWEAEQYIPFDINDVNIDVQVLTADPGEQGQMDVLLVAAKKDMINDYLAVVQEAQLTPMVVDVATFCIQNAFEVNYEIPASDTIAIINVGASVINIDIVSDGTWAFSRDISMGGHALTEEIQKQLNVSHDEAEALKLGGYSSNDADSVVPQEVERVIASVTENMVGEIQRSLDFFTATAGEGQLSRIYLCGGTCRLPSLYKIIENKVGVPVEIMNPFRNIEFDSKRFDPEYIRQVGPAAAVAVGLALRSPDDK